VPASMVRKSDSIRSEYWIVAFLPDPHTGYQQSPKLYTRVGSLINAIDNRFGFGDDLQDDEFVVYHIDLSAGTALQVEAPTWRTQKIRAR
jgi:hypothetical protein